MEPFIKQMDDFLSLDGFKRAALEEKFLNATMIFLKTKLLEIATLDLGRCSKLRTVWAA